MSENLIYGADVLGYGAVGDGKSDCTEAFIKAIENGESLISVPFGKYLITRPLVLSSNTKLCIHPSACIYYVPKDKNAKQFIFAKDAHSIEICGGIFNIAEKVKCKVFSFEACQNIRISSCLINTPDALSCFNFDNCEDIYVSEVRFNGLCDSNVFTGKCENITVKNCHVTSSVNFLQCGTGTKSCDISNLQIRNIDVQFCDSFLEFLNGKAENVAVENINAAFFFAFAKLFEKFDLEDATLEKIDVYMLDRGLNEGKTKTYFSFASCPDGFELRNFKRNSDLESTPFVPSFIIKNTNADKAKMIIDGIALDNVIAARGKSKTVSMTTAKLTNPCNKFIYTLEIGVDKDDTFTLPYGDFDYLRIDRA